MKLKKTVKEDFFNLPNTITLARICLIPITLFLMACESPVNCFWATVIFAFASSTDFVDGWIARHYNLITITGKFMDPLADKLIVMSTLIMLITLGRVPAWVVILLLTRELAVTSLRALAAGEGIVMAAGQEGKWKAALQMAGIVGLILYYPYDINFFLFTARFHFYEIGLILLYASLFFSMLSMVKYLRWFAQEADRIHQEAKAKR